MTTFPRTPHSKLGYNVEQVERFLQEARVSYDLDDRQKSGDTARMTAADIRRRAFSMQKGGFAPADVDAAMERLEDAFASRDREQSRREMGAQAWIEQARATAQVILNRLNRPDKHKFDRTSILTLGYNCAEVDTFAGRLSGYFQDAKPLSVDQVRTAVFRPQRGGYREAQVDLLLDSVTDVMLAVR
ncbi:MAG: DivIVA domain-containing protein [Microbacteriaceae bacterium]